MSETLYRVHYLEVEDMIRRQRSRVHDKKYKSLAAALRLAKELNEIEYITGAYVHPIGVPQKLDESGKLVFAIYPED